MISGEGTDEFSEWQVSLSVSSLLTFCLHFAVCVTCDGSTLVGMTIQNICIIPMITFELAAFFFLLLNIIF